MSLKRILNDDSDEGSTRPGWDYQNGNWGDFSQIPSTNCYNWDSFSTGFQDLLNGETLPPDSYAPLNYDGPLSYMGYDIDEDIGTCITPSDELTTASSSLSTQYNEDNTSSDNTADTSFISDPSDSCVAEQVFESNDDQEVVCYGMIYRAAVKVVGAMAEIDRKLAAGCGKGPSGLHEFRLRAGATAVGVEFSDGVEFGLLDQNSTEAMESLLERPELDCNVFAEINAIRSTIGKAQKATDAVVRVHININGPKSLAQDIGQDLSNSKMWLQRPLTTRSPYHNPHVIKFDDIEPHNVVDLEEASSETTKEKKQSVEEFQKTVAEVYKTLNRDKDLSRIQGDVRLRTQLLQHQEEALDFMTQRETGLVSEKYRLWKPEEQNGQKRFKHSITNHCSQLDLEEKGGGVLADEMGMGKSLSILSLIIKTMDEARDWFISQSKSEDDSVRSNQCSRATLIIVSSALLINGWMSEIDRHLHSETVRSLKTIRWHGSSRTTFQTDLRDADIVITTYNTLATEYKERPSILHDISWYRIVLDEAHIIRRQATIFYKACYDLTALSRWCLTGTPIQNRLEDVGTLFAFIRAKPFDRLATFRQYMVIPYEEGGERRRIACERLVALLDSLCLRRTKELLELPGCENVVVPIVLSPEERKQYESTKRIMDRIFRQSAGVWEHNNRFGLFQAMLQLRIFCNHGTFQRQFSWNRISQRDMREAAIVSLGENSETRCSGCKLPMPVLGSNRIHRVFVEDCAHVYCSECLEDSSGTVDISGQRHCPLCIRTGTAKKAILLRDIEHSVTKEIRQCLETPYESSEENDDHYFQWHGGYSSKMKALMRDLRKDLLSTKSIVFSCWTRTLNLIDWHLHQDGIAFKRIDGGVALKERQTILDEFAVDEENRVLIMTTGTGAFGLNLTAANRVFLVEPQWNPSVENQAIARTIRLGQASQVLVTRYVVQDSVEKDMLSQQNRKRQIASIGH